MLLHLLPHPDSGFCNFHNCQNHLFGGAAASASQESPRTTPPLRTHEAHPHVASAAEAQHHTEGGKVAGLETPLEHLLQGLHQIGPIAEALIPTKNRNTQPFPLPKFSWAEQLNFVEPNSSHSKRSQFNLGHTKTTQNHPQRTWKDPKTQTSHSKRSSSEAAPAPHSRAADADRVLRPAQVLHRQPLLIQAPRVGLGHLGRFRRRRRALAPGEVGRPVKTGRHWGVWIRPTMS